MEFVSVSSRLGQVDSSVVWSRSKSILLSSMNSLSVDSLNVFTVGW